MAAVRIVDVADEPSFRLIPPCADPGFDHRSCDYWEDAERGSKAARLSWLGGVGERTAGSPPRGPTTSAARTRNPFATESLEPAPNPFAPPGGRKGGAPVNPFAEDQADSLAGNPFAPQRASRPTVGLDAPRKLGLLGRGIGLFGSYAKVLLVDDVPVAYAQFGPLSAYPRALRLRDLYRQLPEAPLPAVITCIATTAAARRLGHARRLVEAVCADLAGRGFAAVEAYPEVGARVDATSGATPDFWLRAGFRLAVDDPRYPVVRRELG